MNTLMARLWISGALLGLAYGVVSGGGITAIVVMPLLGATLGILVAMGVHEVRGQLKKLRR